MSCDIIMTVEEMQDRPKWLEMRRTGLGGSDAPAIVGMSKWKSPWDLWLEKTGQVELEDKSDNEYIYWGNALEDLVARRFCELTGKKVKRCGMLRNREYPFVLADVDRLVIGENAILECKTAASWKEDEWADDNIPDSYYLQIQHYLMCGGYDKAYVACLLGGNRFIWKEIERNEEDIQSLLEAEKYFWEHNVVAKELPTVDSSDACSRAIGEHFKGGVTEAEELEGDFDVLCRDLAALKDDKKKLELIIAEKENKLKVRMGNSEFGRSAKYNVYLKTTNRDMFNAKQFAKDYPDLYKKYIRTTSYRSLRVHESKARKED